MAALLTIEAANTDKLAMYLGECRDLGVPILAARHQHEPAGVHGRDGRRPLRPVRGQERRRGRDPVDARRAQGARPHRLALHALRARRPAAGQQAAARKPGQGRRVRLAAPDGRHVAARRARLFAAVDKAIEHGSRQQRDRDKGQSSASSAAADDGAAGATSRCPTPRRGPRPSSSPSRRRRSAST